MQSPTLPSSMPTPPPSNQKAGSRKRQFSETEKENTDPKTIQAFSDDEDDDVNMVPEHNCNQIRQMLKKVVDTKELTVKDLCKNLGVSSVGYYRFMKQHGADAGWGSDVYMNACVYFKKRKDRGVPMPKKQKTSSADKGDSSAKKTTSTKTKTKAEILKEYDVSDIHLDGEEEDAVPIYLTCDMVRKQITDFLRRKDVTPAILCNLLSEQVKEGGAITSTRLKPFRGKSGPNAGASTNCFYAAYVFFEKLRIRENKPKSEDREAMEEQWASKGGFTRDSNIRVICKIGHPPSMDRLGVLHFR